MNESMFLEYSQEMVIMFLIRACEGKVPVVPIAGVHTEEMYFSPLAYLWNAVGGSTAYASLVQVAPKGPFKWILIQFRLAVSFQVCYWISIPIPVKAGMVVGKPLFKQENESVDAFALRCEASLQSLLYLHNNSGGKPNYVKALMARVRKKV